MGDAQPHTLEADQVREPVNEDGTLAEQTEDEYPDGGKRAWLTLFGCFCSFFAALSMMNSAGVYQNWISQHQLKDETAGDIGWIFGFYNFFSFFAGLPLGPVFDAKGPRALSCCGAVLLLATYIILGFCQQYWHFFLCFGILGSLGTCLLFTSAIGTIQHWFLRRRGLATGVAISGGSVGGIVSPLILGALLPKIGFAWSMRVMALLMVPFVALGVSLMRSRLHPQKTSSASFLPDPRILTTPRMIILAIGAFFVELGLFIPMTYITSYALSYGMSTGTAYRMVMLLNVGSLIGRWLPGWLGDKWGRFNAQIAALSLCLVSVLGIWLPLGHRIAGLTAFVVLFGLGSGSGISLVPVCIGQLCKTEDYGKTFTAIYSVASFGSLIGIPLGGRILQAADNSYLGLIIFVGLAYTIALGCFVAVRVISVGFVSRKRF
ncbi:MFS transporter, MCP family, solute carrier family 16, member 10 [Dactylonectria macrodidyma]|uniref:MFS transporter, MCP family, solute carrier family 16, member 10 n=1 Tax=Dactylonectria macrodidyma TaxID=307937 RepID=A0A9P9E571_9HYPO|nr:MFS transporter, MCP family, solute carrier family 16, member 10 [Dactylonectria macrodidyma]